MQLFNILSLESSKVKAARKACQNFGEGWVVGKVSDGALVCTKAGRTYQSNCAWGPKRKYCEAADLLIRQELRDCGVECDTWRLVVWDDGSNEYKLDENNPRYSTKAGKYYGGHLPCKPGDNYQLCGDWNGMDSEVFVIS